MSKSVFISSTSKDLKDHREAVDKAIRRLKLRPINMDDFGAQPGGATGVSLSHVGEADIFVGIIARRYGYIPDGQTLSVTEQEYDEAVRRNIPRLMYLLDPAYTWPSEHIESTAESKVDAFRTKIERTDVRSLFTTPDALAAQVTADLTNLLTAPPEPVPVAPSKRFWGGLSIAWKSVLAILAFLALLATILAVFPQQQRNNLLYTVGMLPASATPTTTATNTPLPTQTSTPTSTLTPTITSTATLTPTANMTPTSTATPMEGKPFTKDQVGLVFADFKHLDSDASNVEDNIDSELRDARVPYIRVHHMISNREEARKVSDIYNATIVMWGEIARGGVRIFFEVMPRRSIIDTDLNELKVTTTELTSFDAYLFQGMDTLYIINFIAGQIFYFDADYVDALSSFDNSVSKIQPERITDLKVGALYFYRANTYFQQDKFDLAVADYTQAIQLDPQFAQAYNNRGITLSDQGKPEAAIADYDKAIQLNPQYAQAYYNRGNALSDQGKLDAAIVDYTQAIQLDPQYAQAYNNRGYALSDQGKLEAAIVDYTQAIQLDPELAEAYNNRGIALSDQGKLEAAIADYTQAIQLDPQDAQAYYNRGNALSDQDKLEAAIADYTQAIQLDPQDARVYWNRGNAYYKQKHYAEALQDYQTYLKFAGSETTSSDFAWIEKVEAMLKTPTPISTPSITATPKPLTDLGT